MEIESKLCEPIFNVCRNSNELTKKLTKINNMTIYYNNHTQKWFILNIVRCA